MFAQAYASQVLELLDTIRREESERIDQAGRMLADRLAEGGLLYVFGCGHSHMIEEELFYRAGGLAAVNPIFETSAMLHEGAVKSSQIERMSGYAPHVLARYPIGPKDVLLAVSTSGVNPFPIEMAEAAREKGAAVIVVSSFAYLDKSARTADGRHLPDVADLTIDNHVPSGDAAIQVRSDGTKAGPVSSIASIFIANSMMLSACEHLRQRGVEPEVFLSGNCPGGDQYNKDLIERFRSRVKSL